jgi:hypothetical protein
MQAKHLSLLRSLVEQIPTDDTLRVEGTWTWLPDVTVDVNKLRGFCPATGTEGGED